MIELIPGFRSGVFTPPSSKSDAHRKLISAALTASACRIGCADVSDDLRATADCLRALGANVSETAAGFRCEGPVEKERPDEAGLDCGESGTTFRLLLPVCAALGRKAVFRLRGRLPSRPHGDLIKELSAHGATVVRDGDRVKAGGRLVSGRYEIPGNISSQFISGLLFALPLLNGDSELNVTGNMLSAPYVAMTERTLGESGIIFEKNNGAYFIPGNQSFHSPAKMTAEPDWSGAAAMLCMGAFSETGIGCGSLPERSAQGDKAVLDVLRAFGANVVRHGDEVTVSRGRLSGQTVDASQIPDLVPVIAALAAGANGKTVIRNASRLRLKETDRLKTVTDALNALGADVRETEDGLAIRGQNRIRGGKTSSFGDHRIAMACAVASQFSISPVLIENESCVSKSFPSFWEQFNRLEVVRR